MEIVLDKDRIKSDLARSAKSSFNGLLNGDIVPSHHKSELELGACIINAAHLLEENIREFNSNTLLSIKHVSYGNVSTPRAVDLKKFSQDQLKVATDALKELNSVYEQALIKGKGRKAVLESVYRNIPTVNKFYTLDLNQQQEVTELVNKLYNQNQ